MENITTPIIETPIIVQKPKTNYLNLILISLCFVLFLAGAYYLGKQSSVTPDISVTPTPVKALPQTTAIPTSTADPTANWKTYTDVNLGISYSFPKDWYITPTDGINFRIQNYNPDTAAGRGYDPTADQGKTFIAFLKRSDLSATSLPVLKSSLTKDSVCYSWGDEAGNTVVANSYIKKVNSIEYLYLKTYCSKNNPSTAHTSVFIINSGKVIELGFGLDESVAEKYFESVLSTFKFTESKAETSVLPNSNKLQIAKDYSAYFIFNNKKYIFDKKPVDYSGNIIYSPSQRYACIDFGVSGDWSFHLFDLKLNKTLLSGKSYSYCEKWSSTNQLTVKEIPYGQSISTFYIIDPITLNKTIFKQ